MNKYLVLARFFNSNRLGLLQPFSKRLATTNSGGQKDFAEQEGLAATGDASDDLSSASIVPDVEESIFRQQQMREKHERMRNVSRFPKLSAEAKHRNSVPDLTKTKDGMGNLNKPQYFRRLYARLGRASGIEPGVAWPTKSELDQIIADEKEYDLSLEKKIQILIERKTAEFEESQKLINETTNTLLKMPKMIDGYFERIARFRKQGEIKAQKKQQLKDKARELFGYDLDPRDPRFLEVMAEEKKAAAKSKKMSAQVKK